MIRNALIAIYILAVLAISAVSRAESRIPDYLLEPKHRVKPILIPPRSADPLPRTRGIDQTVKTLRFGNSGVRK